ncbi:MAG TPA: hypothetical protein VLD19_07975, partial [Chitinophagaceae bacterium]|nr:hypothetical protein [Chitinophagaceae bacterium]
MNQAQKETSIGMGYVLATGAAVGFTWLLHEFSHWATGRLLGESLIMTLNTCYPKSGHYTGGRHEIIISAAGPAITIVQAFIFYLLLKRSPGKRWFPFFLTCVYMRLLAGAMNFINLNDEGRISKSLGLGTFTLPLLVVAVLFWLAYDVIKTRRFGTKLVLITTGLIMLFSSVL